MTYYQTLQEDIDRAKQILENGRPKPEDLPNFDNIPFSTYCISYWMVFRKT